MAGIEAAVGSMLTARSPQLRDAPLAVSPRWVGPGSLTQRFSLGRPFSDVAQDIIESALDGNWVTRGETGRSKIGAGTDPRLH